MTIGEIGVSSGVGHGFWQIDQTNEEWMLSVLRPFRAILKYRRDRGEFKKQGGEITHRHVIVGDFFAQAGSATGHYFHQDLLVANLIATKKPKRHIDVGSRIDGFVAHVAAFRKIEVVDIRPLHDTNHDNIKFIQLDLTSKNLTLPQTDSLSCLHAIEHFGLGRYGDPVDPDGHKKGFKNLVDMLQKGAMLYISFPIASENQVHFNAHRVFHPQDIFNWPSCEKLKLQRFDFVDERGDLQKDIAINSLPKSFSYCCGIYSLIKL